MNTIVTLTTFTLLVRVTAAAAESFKITSSINVIKEHSNVSIILSKKANRQVQGLPKQTMIDKEALPYVHISNMYCEYYESGEDCRVFDDVWDQCKADGDKCMGVMWNSCISPTPDIPMNGSWKLMTAGQEVGGAHHPRAACEGRLGHWDVFVRKDMMSGVIHLDRMIPLTLGATIGTTLTDILASSLNSLPSSLPYLFFNITGTLMWYPIPFMRTKVPTNTVRRLRESTPMWGGSIIVFIFIIFVIISILLLGVTLTPGVPNVFIVWGPCSIIIVILVLIIAYTHYKMKKDGDIAIDRKSDGLSSC